MNDRHFNRLRELLKDGSVICGGAVDEKTRYIAPTLIENVSEEDRIMQEEIFGPLLPIIEYETLEEAISFVNARPKPLSLYFFSENSEKQRMVLERISFGTGCINDAVIQFANLNLPFGGVGNSGIGAYHGRASFETFSHRKSVMRGARLREIRLRYPPYRGKLKRLKMMQ